MLLLALLGTALTSLVPVALLLLLPLLPIVSGRRAVSPFKSSRQWTPSPTTLNLMLSFAAGSLLGDAFLHILCQSMLGDYPSPQNTHRAAMCTLWGFVLFYALDTLSRLGYARAPHSSEGDGQTKSPDLLLTPLDRRGTPGGSVGGGGGGGGRDSNVARKRGTPSPGLKMLSTGQPQCFDEPPNQTRASAAIPSLIADAIHNFTDGLAISAAFSRDIRLGLSTTLAILFHEIPHELGDYAILAKAGFRHGQIIALQLLTALGAFLGVLVGAGVQYGWFPKSLSVSQDSLLPFAAGGFIYVALCTILPDVLGDCSETGSLSRASTSLIAFSAGIIAMALLD